MAKAKPDYVSKFHDAEDYVKALEILSDPGSTAFERAHRQLGQIMQQASDLDIQLERIKDARELHELPASVTSRAFIALTNLTTQCQHLEDIARTTRTVSLQTLRETILGIEAIRNYITLEKN